MASLACRTWNSCSWTTHPCCSPLVPFQIIPPGGRIEPRIEFSTTVCQIHSAQWVCTLNTVNSAITAARSTFREAFWTELQASFCKGTSEFFTVFQAVQQGSGDAVHLVECLPGTQGDLDLIPHKPDMVVHTFTPALGRSRQESGQFKLILSYIVIPRPAWAT